MPFLSSAGSNRRCVLLCARLLVQCVMVWSTPQAGMDELKDFRLADATSGYSLTRYERELATSICTSR